MTEERVATEPAKQVMTVGEVARLLQVSRRTVERLHIPSLKLGRCRRYLLSDVLTYLREKAS